MTNWELYVCWDADRASSLLVHHSTHCKHTVTLRYFIIKQNPPPQNRKYFTVAVLPKMSAIRSIRGKSTMWRNGAGVIACPKQLLVNWSGLSTFTFLFNFQSKLYSRTISVTRPKPLFMSTNNNGSITLTIVTLPYLPNILRAEGLLGSKRKCNSHYF